MSLLYVAAGGALGAVLRHLIGKVVGGLLGHGFPYATLGVNILGSLAMGLFIGLMAKADIPASSWHLFVAVGVLGGFTTFSTFSLDAVSLLQRGEHVSALLYICSSVSVSLLALVCGTLLMRQV